MGKVRKVPQEYQITAKHEEFAILVADPTDKRSIGEKAEVCGFSRGNANRLLARPAIAEMVKRYTAENLEAIRHNAPAVLEVIARMAIEEKDLKAASLFLEAYGLTGKGAPINITTNVTTRDAEFVDRLREIRERVARADTGD